MEKPITRKKSEAANRPLFERFGKRKIIILVFSFIIFCLTTIFIWGIPAEYNLTLSILARVQAISALFTAGLSVHLFFLLSKGFVQKIIAIIASVFILFSIGFVVGIPHKTEVAETDYVKDSGQQNTDLNVKNDSGDTLLMLAASDGRTDIVKVLLAKGADVNAKNNDGATALLYAIDGGHTDTVKVLLAKGADINARTYNGFTALMIAKEKGHKDIVRILKEAGAKD